MMKEFKVPFRILMGPGPSNIDPRVLDVMAQSPLNHMDSVFENEVMDVVQEGLRMIFEADNPMTFPVSGSGTAGMETAMVNMVEPGDSVLICTAGFFASRMAEIAERVGGRVTRLEAAWGEAFEPEQIIKAIDQCRPSVLGFVHVETSTGVAQPLEPLAEICKREDIVSIVDAVASLGGQPLSVSKNKFDFTYSGSQKCLSSSPGLAPISLSHKALRKLENRSTPVQSWYFDLTLLGKYWRTNDRDYHHTAPINLHYALREALKLVEEEGLVNRFARHRQNHIALVAGLEAMGLEMFVRPENRAWTVNTIRVPDGVNEAEVRATLLERHGIEIVGGLGVLKAKIWRVGLMGSSSTKENILLLLSALEEILIEHGCEISKGSGVEAANDSY